MSLADVIRSRPSVAPGTSVQDAVALMTANNMGAIPVVEGRRLVGIFSERDLMRRVVLVRKDSALTPVRDVMTTPVQTIAPTATLEEAVAVMQDRHIRHLVVLDDGGAVRGVVGLRYLLYDLLSGLERKVDELQSFIMTDGPGG